MCLLISVRCALCVVYRVLVPVYRFVFLVSCGPYCRCCCCWCCVVLLAVDAAAAVVFVTRAVVVVGVAAVVVC